MRQFLLLSLSFCCFQLSAQTYDEFAAQARQLHEQKNYAAAAQKYSEAFRTMGWRGYIPDRYDAACCWAMAGVPDSAFFQLYRLTEKVNFDDLESMQAEAELKPLQTDTRWSDLCAKVKANQPTMPELKKELEAIHYDDQHYRLLIDSIQERYGMQSPELQQLWRTISTLDSANLVDVAAILDQYGWLGPKEVGDSGNSTLFLVIQHSELTVQEKYLPMMQQAVKDGKARGTDLALLEDRVNMRNGRKQVYGSQIRQDPKTGAASIFPIEDPKHVDARRAAVGLRPLAEYVAHWNLIWNDEEAEKMEKQPVPKY